MGQHKYERDHQGLGMAIWVGIPDTHRVSDPTELGTEMIFLSTGDTCTRPEMGIEWVFFSTSE
jgi:hypothetical protein